jgi:hypothetical protein
MNALPELLVELEKNVTDEIEVQTAIQALLDQQLEILTTGGTRKLAAVLANAEEGLEESRKLEAQRVELLARLAVELGVPAKEISLKLIEERVGSHAASLSGKGAELKALLARIRERNAQVGLLLRHSVLFIDHLVRAISGGASGAPTYTRQGAMQAPSSGTIAAEA